MITEPVERHLTPRLLESLADTRVVVIQGARQVGKTTLDSLAGRAENVDLFGFS